jgi:hypothetical protein
MNQEQAKTEKVFGPVISVYSEKQAVEDGILFRVCNIDGKRIVFTCGIMASLTTRDASGIEKVDVLAIKYIIRAGLLELRRVMGTDAEGIAKLEHLGTIWAVEEPGKVTFMRPDEY